MVSAFKRSMVNGLVGKIARVTFRDADDPHSDYTGHFYAEILGLDDEGLMWANRGGHVVGIDADLIIDMADTGVAG